MFLNVFKTFLLITLITEEEEKRTRKTTTTKPTKKTLTGFFFTFIFIFLQHDSESVNHKKQTRNCVPTIPIYSTHSSSAQRYPIPVHLS